jgi:hypothetical protein
MRNLQWQTVPQKSTCKQCCGLRESSDGHRIHFLGLALALSPRDPLLAPSTLHPPMVALPSQNMVSPFPLPLQVVGGGHSQLECVGITIEDHKRFRTSTAHLICHPCSRSSAVEIDANMPLTHPSEQGAHAFVFRFYASDSIFMNADYLSWKWDSIVSSPLFLLWIRVFYFILVCFFSYQVVQISWYIVTTFFALVIVFVMDGC